MILHQLQEINRERGSSETLRNESGLDFIWLAGLIDANGGFYISRGQSLSCEIKMHEKEVQTLHFIKHFLGGSVNLRVGKKTYRWRLHKRVPLEKLLHQVNGSFQTKRLQTQFLNACQVSKITPLASENLTLESAWLSGFFSGDGSFSIKMTAPYEPSASISQAEKKILEKVAFLLGGKVYYDRSRNGWIWWIDLRRNRFLLDYLQNYSMNNPAKQARLKSMSRFLGYLERGLQKDPDSQARLRHFVSLFQKN